MSSSSARVFSASRSLADICPSPTGDIGDLGDEPGLPKKLAGH
ncbi:MAG TPA: hypothetical protein VNY05_11375 [Candidatus Acidoferrales bacterium]|nr:hypothetical protein [Candidatus Acidoferrales bacterium]